MKKKISIGICAFILSGCVNREKYKDVYYIKDVYLVSNSDTLNIQDSIYKMNIKNINLHLSFQLEYFNLNSSTLPVSAIEKGLNGPVDTIFDLSLILGNKIINEDYFNKIKKDFNDRNKNVFGENLENKKIINIKNKSNDSIISFHIKSSRFEKKYKIKLQNY